MTMGAPLLLAVLLCGCSGFSNHAATGPIELEGDLNNIWNAGQSHLKERGFELETVDLRSGIIKTYPQVSKQWFELWAKDVADATSLAESSLQTIRRTVSLHLTPKQKNQYYLQCQVAVERNFNTQPFIGGTVRAEDVYTSANSRVLADSVDSWIPLGSDPALENAILAAIKKSL